MSTKYGSIAFTEHVKAVQDTYGSGDFYARHAARGAGQVEGDALTADVTDFLDGRDSFYLATVSETGWPYVQHRGGAPGFVRTIDDHTIGWADFRGNLQHVSTGNLSTDDRVALIAVDYPTRRRLKIYGHARVVRAEDDPDLAARLTRPDHDAIVERAVVVTVEAYDWNCPQHITPRFTVAELSERIAPMRMRLESLETENALLREELADLRATTA
jgi:predicted pyridoxine 5'-phosphate oxidase superfamily flavin-nucleotide-binding protein